MHKTKLTIIHPNGPKYFNFLASEYDVRYMNINILRKLIGRNKISTNDNLIKIFFPSKINIICLPPFDPNIFWINVLVKLFPNKIFIYHTSYPDHQNGYFLKKMPFKKQWRDSINRYDLIVTPIPTITDKLKSIYEPKVKYIPHPITLKQSKLTNKNNNHIKNIGFLGELSHKKGIDRFFNLCRKNKNFVFHVAGPNLESVKIPNHIVNHGVLDRVGVEEYLQMIDILIVPSRKSSGWEELFGIVIIEALSKGCLIFATDHIGPKYFFENYSNIALCEDNDYYWDALKLPARYDSKHNDLTEFDMLNTLNIWSQEIEYCNK